MGDRKKGIIMSYAYIIIHALVNFLYVPILLKYIGNDEYGLYQIVGSLFAYITVLESSLETGVLRFYCNAKASGNLAKMENTLAIARVIYRVFSVIIAVLCPFVLVAFRSFYTGALTQTQLAEGTWMLVVLFANLIITMANSVYLASITANEKFAFIKFLAIINQILQPLLCVLILKKYSYAIVVLAIQVILNIMLCLVRFYYSRHILKVTVALHQWDKKLGKSIIVFAGGILLAAIADQIFWKADQIILGKLYSTTVVAIYSIGSQIFTNYSFFGTAISSVFYPQISRLYERADANKRISDIFIKIGRISFEVLFLILSGYIIFGREFISIWVGSEYREAYYIALVVLVPFTVDLIQNIGLTILQVENKYSFRAKMYFVAALLNIVSTVILAKLWGGFGAALSTGITMAITSGLIMNTYYYREIHIDVIGFWKNIGTILIRMIPIMVVIFALNLILPTSTTFVSLIAKVLIYVAIYIFAMIKWTFNEYEKELVHKVAMKLFFGKKV